MRANVDGLLHRWGDRLGRLLARDQVSDRAARRGSVRGPFHRMTDTSPPSATVAPRAPSRAGRLACWSRWSSTFLGLLLVTFVIGRVVPIDPVLSILGERATEAQIAEVRDEAGAGRAAVAAVRRSMSATRCRAISAPRSAPASRCCDEIARYFPATLELATLATIIGVAGRRARRACWPRPGPDQLADQIVRLVGLMGYSMPVFWLGLMGLLVFYGQLGWVGGPGRLDPAYRHDAGIRDLTQLHRHDPDRHRAERRLGHVRQRRSATSSCPPGFWAMSRWPTSAG